MDGRRVGAGLAVALWSGWAAAEDARVPQVNGWYVSETIEIQAPPALVYGILADFHEMPSWSAWGVKRDPDAKWTFSGEPGTVGHAMAWDGPKVKTGSMAWVMLAPDAELQFDLLFGKSPKNNPGNFQLAPTGDGTTVTWETTGPMGAAGRLLFRGAAEKAISADFKLGLAQLKVKAELAAAAAKAAEASEAAAKAAAEAAEAAAKAAEAAAAETAPTQ